MAFFGSVDDVRDRLAATGYLCDDTTATAVFLADALGKPLLLEGPAGTGKTELAKAVAAVCDAELVRLQCYEGLDEARALYEWNYRKQLLRIQAAQALRPPDSGPPDSGPADSGPADSGPMVVAVARPSADAGEAGWDSLHDDIFSEEFLLARPLLTAIRRTGPTVLLVDETDKADVEVEGLLLEVLSDFQVTVPELGTITATRRPFVVLTSNATRDLSEALKRRCLYVHIGYPDAERERAIVLARVPEAAEQLGRQVVDAVRAMRALDLRKPPSIAETIDWARTVLALGHDRLTDETAAATLGVVLKHHSDQQRAGEALGLGRR